MQKYTNIQKCTNINNVNPWLVPFNSCPGLQPNHDHCSLAIAAFQVFFLSVQPIRSGERKHQSIHNKQWTDGPNNPMSTKVFSYTGCFPGQIYLQTISKGKTWFSDFWHWYKCKNLQLLCRIHKSQEGYFVEAGAVNGVLDSNSLVWN